MKFDSITIVHIDGREKTSDAAIFALEESIKQLEGSKGLLLSPNKPENLPDYIEHKEIPKLGYHEYSLFVIYALHQFINTDYVIIVQDDGWVVNGSAWRDDFFDYDYIGAPIHIARVTNDDGSKSVYQGFQWTKYSETLKIENVFNGGFSFRSKRFLEAPARFSIPYILSAPIGLGKYPKILIWEDECNQEDVQLCLYMRPELEKCGIKFPTIDIAKYFSFEHLTPKIHENLDLNEVLGHHAYIRKLKNTKVIEYKSSIKDILSIYGEDRVIEYFSDAGYSFTFKQ